MTERGALCLMNASLPKIGSDIHDVVLSTLVLRWMSSFLKWASWLQQSPTKKNLRLLFCVFPPPLSSYSDSIQCDWKFSFPSPVLRFGILFNMNNWISTSSLRLKASNSFSPAINSEIFHFVRSFACLVFFFVSTRLLRVNLCMLSREAIRESINNSSKAQAHKRKACGESWRG